MILDGKSTVDSYNESLYRAAWTFSQSRERFNIHLGRVSHWTARIKAARTLNPVSGEMYLADVEVRLVAGLGWVPSRGCAD